jgi:hypothetical protein
VVAPPLRPRRAAVLRRSKPPAECDVDQAAVEVDVTDLQAAQLTAADTGDHH